MSAVLIDCVATGQRENLFLNIPISCVSALHIIADGEERGLFPIVDIRENRRLTAYNVSDTTISSDGDSEHIAFGAPGNVTYKRLKEVHLPGARHSDAAGVYKSGGYRELAQYLISTFRASLGLNVPVLKPSIQHVQNIHANDSRWMAGKIVDAITDPIMGTGRAGSSRRSSVPRKISNQLDYGDEPLQVWQQMAPEKVSILSNDSLKTLFPRPTDAFAIINEPELAPGESQTLGSIAMESIMVLTKFDALAFFDSLRGLARNDEGFQISRQDFLERIKVHESLMSPSAKAPSAISKASAYATRGSRPSPTM